MCEYCENTFSNKRNKNIMEGELKTFTGVPLCKFRTYLDVNQFDNTPELKTDLFTYENYTEPENGTKLRELIISGGMQEINYCPYCGRRLNLKAPKLRSMREIYDTFGWKPEGWDIDDFDILDPKNPREENSDKSYEDSWDEWSKKLPDQFLSKKKSEDALCDECAEGKREELRQKLKERGGLKSLLSKDFLDSIGYYDSPCKNCSSDKASCCCPEWLEWINKRDKDLRTYKEED